MASLLEEHFAVSTPFPKLVAEKLAKLSPDPKHEAEGGRVYSPLPYLRLTLRV